MADIQMPQLGETVTEGTITKWFKNVGDTVTADEPLFEVSTDKVDTEVPSPIAGVLTEIRAAEGDIVEVGAVIAVVGDAGAAPVAGVVETPTQAAAETPAVEAPAVEAPAVEAPAVEAPAVEAPAVEVPAVQASSSSAAAPTPAVETAPAVVAPVVEAPTVPTTAAADPVAGASVSGGDNRLLSPVVRRLVADNGLNPSDIPGTGPGGRITREDVLDHLDRRAANLGDRTEPASATSDAAASAPAAPLAAPAAPPVAAPPTAPVAVPVAAPAAPPAPPAAAPLVAAGARDTVIPLSKIRRLTGDHMIMSKAAAPHAFSVVEVDFANVDKARNAVKGEWKASEGFSLTYLPFISRAVIDAIAEYPHMNASVSGDQLIVHNFVDLGIAVDLDYQGLLVPVVRSAEGKRLRAVAREINDLAGRARSRKLSPDEINGGTFTISNNGSAGSVLTMPVINQPQVAILSTDAIVRRPVVVTDSVGGESIAIHPVGNLAMAWDHRAFDGAYAAGFLVAIKKALETRDWAAEL